MRAILAAAVIACITYLHADTHIDFADEGLLWYGSAAVLKGQVPLRDFFPYDPGRFYWGSLFLHFFGNRLMALRFAEAVFQFIGLCFGLLAAKRAIASFWGLLAFGSLASFWMLLNFRYFDAVMPMSAVFFATRYAEMPTKWRSRDLGLMTGLAAFFGVNHALYIAMAFLALIVFMRKKADDGLTQKLAFFCVGTALGLLPIFAMWIFIPGFYESYIDRFFHLIDLANRGLTASLPVPWPWTLDLVWLERTFPDKPQRLCEFLHQEATGTAFLMVVTYYVIAAGALFFVRKSGSPYNASQSFDGTAPPNGGALFVGSAFVGFFYLQHIFSRPNLAYLGEGMFPVLAGWLACFSSFQKKGKKCAARMLLFFLSVISFFSVGMVSALFFKLVMPEHRLVHYPVGRDKIWLFPVNAEMIDRFRSVVTRHVPGNEPVFLAPMLTTFYCLLDKEAPAPELYFMLPLSEKQRLKVLESLKKKKVNWAIVNNEITGPRFSENFPDVWNYLAASFERIPGTELPPGYVLLKRKK